jgi:hypothetical protein
VGYYGLLVGLEFKYDAEMLEKFDSENYDDSQLVTIKLPIAVPYAVDSRGFERVDGKFEHNGEFYRMVKQKVSADTIYLVCIKDHQGKRINQVLTSYVKTFADNPADSQSHSKLTYNFIKDYLKNSFAIVPLSNGWECDVVKETSPTFLTSDFFPSIVHPPERV